MRKIILLFCIIIISISPVFAGTSVSLGLGVSGFSIPEENIYNYILFSITAKIMQTVWESIFITLGYESNGELPSSFAIRCGGRGSCLGPFLGCGIVPLSSDIAGCFIEAGGYYLESAFPSDEVTGLIPCIVQIKGYGIVPYIKIGGALYFGKESDFGIMFEGIYRFGDNKTRLGGQTLLISLVYGADLFVKR